MLNRQLFLLSILFALAFSTSAQEWRIGVQPGVSYTNSFYTRSPVMSPALEINTDRSIGERFYVQGGIRYTETKESIELRYGDQFVAGVGYVGNPVKATSTDKSIQIPFSVRYRIMGNQLSWRAGLGIVPDMIYLSTFKIDGGRNSKMSLSEFGLALSLHLLDLEYRLTEATSVGADFDHQFYLISPYFIPAALPKEPHSRSTLFLTLAHRICKK